MNIYVLVAIFVVFQIILVLFYRKTGRKKGAYPRNIFTEKEELKLPQHPLHKKTLKKLIKKSLLEHPEVLEEEYDCIVIGSGISGMTAAGMLSKAKKKVLLLEQNKKLGGLTHCFKKKGHKFCVGIHFVLDLTPDINLVADKLIKKRPHCTSECFEIGEGKIVIESEKYENVKKYLFEQFPEEKGPLSSFLNIMEKTSTSTKYGIYGTLVPFFIRLKWWIQGKTQKLYQKYRDTSTEEMLDLCGVKNPVLRCFLKENVLMYYNPNYPMKKNFPLHSRYNQLLLPKKNIIYGPYGVGGDNFAKIIIPNLVARGSEAVGNAEVSKILMNEGNGSAIGVQLKNGKKVHAKHIISSAGVLNTMKMIISPQQQEQEEHFEERLYVSTQLQEFSKQNPYTGYFFVIFMGLKGSVEELGIKHGIHSLQKSSGPDALEQYLSLKAPDFDGFDDCYSIWIFALEALEEEFMKKEEEEGEEEEEEEEEEKKNQKGTRLQILCPANPRWFETFRGVTKHKSRGREYEEIRENMTNLILEKVYEKFPKWEENLEVVEVGTNLSFEHYCRSPHGAGYGLLLGNDKIDGCVMSKEAGGSMIMKPMKNLYCVGADTYSCGVGGQFLSIMFSVGKILKRNLFKDLGDAMKEMKKKEEEKKKKKKD